MGFLNKVQEGFKKFSTNMSESVLNQQVKMILNEDLNVSNLEYESLFLDTLLRDDKLLNELLPKDDLISKRILQIYLIKILYKIEEEKTGKSFEILFERFTTKENKRMIFNLQSEFALLEEYRENSLNNEYFSKIKNFLEKIKYEKRVHSGNPMLLGVEIFLKRFLISLFNKYLVSVVLNIFGIVVIIDSFINDGNIILVLAKFMTGFIFIFVGTLILFYEE